MCANDSRLSEHDQKLFRQFCHILKSLIHFEFHHQVEMLKDCYSPFNPDADTRLNYDYSEKEKKALQKQLVEGLATILNAANFQKITETDLEEALKEESLFKIRLRVEFNDFEEVIFYQRGESTKEETLVKYFGLKKEPITFTNYERVAIYIKFKEEDYFKAKRQKNLCGLASLREEKLKMIKFLYLLGAHGLRSYSKKFSQIESSFCLAAASGIQRR
jgi:hypothetical protein